ncbi:MAG TPA: hypothetical protein VN672_02415 [Solirubrobacteraceae bacterium]|nr:hypothetical protein [Solirubrobacteraceae bacterium]
MQDTRSLRQVPLSFTSPEVADTEQFASRWEPGSFVAHATPTDPYEAWLDERRREVPPGAAAAPGAANRFRLNQRAKAPWEAIRVTLSHDGC